VILPQAAKALEFGRFCYERFTAEGDHVVVLIRCGVAGSNAIIKISEHCNLKDGKVLSVWFAYYQPKALIDQLDSAGGFNSRGMTDQMEG
jgi:hypothetical protein